MKTVLKSTETNMDDVTTWKCHFCLALHLLLQRIVRVGSHTVEFVLVLHELQINKSDISYLKTSQAFNVLIHPTTLLTAILCWLTTL